jgi:anti-sigma regulatory factor (Ser/Thr protein kinase)
MLPDMEIEASKAATSMAEAMQMSPDKIDEVRMAVIEACINAFEHSQATEREIFLKVQILGSEASEKLRITVRDDGVGFAPDEIEAPSLEAKLRAERKRGWGLTIIRGLMDEVEIQSGAQGTTVVMCKAR